MRLFFSEETFEFTKLQREQRQVMGVKSTHVKELSYDVDLISAKGTAKRVRMTPADIYDARGNWLSTLVTLDDITPQQKLTRQLSESEHRFQALVETSIAGVWDTVQPLNPRTRYMNPAMLRLLEIDSLPTALELDPKIFFSEEMWERVLEERARRQRGNGLATFEVELTTSKGNRKWALVSPVDIYDNDGVWLSTLVTYLDVTEHHNLQSELGLRQNLYETLTENTITPIWHTTPEGSTIYMNKAAADLLELERVEEGTALKVMDIMTPESDKIRSEQTKDRRKGMGSRYELDIRTAKGNTCHVQVSAAPLISTRGEWLSSIATFTDLTEKRAREQELEKNLAMFKALIANMPEGILVEDTDHKVVAVNDLLLDIFNMESGRERTEEVAGASTIGGEELVAHLTVNPEGYKDYIRESRKSDVQILGKEVLFVDGRSFVTDYVPISTFSGERIGQLWTYRETTEQKQIERRMRESESQYRLLFQENPHPMWVFDLETLRFLEVNMEAIAKYGYSREEFLAMKISDIRPERELPRLMDALEQHDLANESFRSEFLHRTKSGHELRVDASTNPIEFGGKKARIVLAQDITERRKTEADLYRSRINLQALVENTTDMISSYDRDMRLIAWNSAFENFFRDVFHIEIHEGIALRGHIDPEEADVWEGWMQRGLRGEAFIEEREYNYGPNSTIEVSCFPIIEGNATTGVIFFNRDITMRKQMERDLIVAKEHAEEMNRLKSSFLANMSHEIRTPMTAIQGFASLICETTKEPDTLEFSQRVLTGGKRLLNTLNDILDVARIEANRVDLCLHPLNLAAEVEKTSAFLLPLLEEKHLRLNIRVLSKNVVSNLDSQYFGQIVTNLLSNAIKFTARGEITVEIDREDSDSSYAVVRVRDTGIGIRPEFLPHLFEEFRQESQGLGRRFEGSGLGLTIVKRLTELMHGEISVASVLNQGTQFTLRFPLYFPINSEQFPGTSNGDSKRADHKITLDKFHLLLVEDNADNAELTMHFLRDVCTLDLASNGEEALRACESSGYDLILMDIGLGQGLSGMDVVRKLRQQPEYRDIPIIALTGYAMNSDKIDALDAGCTAFLPKPFTRSELLSTIDEVMEKPSKIDVSA